MWLIGNPQYDVINAWSRGRDYRPQSKESRWRKKMEATQSCKVNKGILMRPIEERTYMAKKCSMFLFSQQLVSGSFGKP